MVAGTTLGIALANVPIVLLGDPLAQRIPLPVVHGVATVLFAILGVLALPA